MRESQTERETHTHKTETGRQRQRQTETDRDRDRQRQREENKTQLTNNHRTGSEGFCSVGTNQFSQLQNYAVHIVMKNALISTLGIVHVAGIYHPPIDCGVNNFQGDPWSLSAFTMAHELGHTLGMRHDEEFCLCGQRGCITNAVRVPAERFSNCTYADFQRPLSTRDHVCTLLQV